MKNWFRCLWLILLLGTCGNAHAFFLIPYTLTIMVPERMGSAIMTPRHYTVLVLLGNYYERNYGRNNGRLFVNDNTYWDRAKYFQDLLSPPYSWYEDRIREHKKIYGPNVEQIILGLRAKEFPKQENSSIVLITEHNNILATVAMLRVSLPNEDGRLDSEAHFLGKGLDGNFGHESLDFRRMSVPYQSENTLSIPINLRTELEIVQMKTVLSGAKAEVKNFAMDPLSRIRFFPHLFLIARRHNMFHYGVASPHHICEAQRRSGFDMPGVYLTDLYLDCYGEALPEMYRELAFEEKATPLNNQHTGHVNLHFMHGNQQNVVESHLRRVLLNEPQGVRLVRRLDLSVLKYDEKLAELLHSANCLQEVLDQMIHSSIRTAESWTN